METSFDPIPNKRTKGTRALIFSLSFLFLFTIGTYALAAGGPFLPSDNVTDPDCAPGDAGCYVDSSSSPSDLSTVLGNGQTNAGLAITGSNFLKVATLDTAIVTNTSDFATLKDDANDNILITGYDGSGDTHPQSTIGFTPGGEIYLDASASGQAGTITSRSLLLGGLDAYSTVGTLGVPNLGWTLDGAFDSVTDSASGNQGVVGSADLSTFGFSSESAVLLHSTANGYHAFTIAYDAGSGTRPTVTSLVQGAGDQSMLTSLTSTAYIVSDGNSQQFLVNPYAHRYALGDIQSSANSTSLVLEDSSNLVSIFGYPDPSGSLTDTGPNFNGTGADDMSVDGTFTGTTNVTFTVTIASANNGLLHYSSEPDGPFTTGETFHVISGAGIGGSGTIVHDDASSSVSYKNLTPGFTLGAGSHLQGDSSGVTVTVTSVTLSGDTFSWTSTDAGSGSDIAIIPTTDQALTDGRSVDFASGSGHDVGDVWTFSSTFSAGKMLSLDGGHGLFQIGDVNGAHGGTKISIDDVSGLISIVGHGGSTCTFDGTAGSLCESDSRLKTNVTTLSDTLADIDKLRPVTYNWIDPNAPQNLNTGFIAQEVQQIFPQFVSQVGDTGYLGVNYQGFIVPAIKAIQELDAKVEPLTSIDPTVDHSLASLMLQFLANAAVTIRQATIGTLNIDDKVCADGVCVTKEQFKNLLLQAGGTLSGGSTPPPSAPAPDPASGGGDSGSGSSSDAGTDGATPPADDGTTTPPSDDAPAGSASGTDSSGTPAGDSGTVTPPADASGASDSTASSSGDGSSSGSSDGSGTSSSTGS